MKTIYIFLILLIFSGCASKNAFSNFNMDEHQELSAQSFKRIKLMQEDEVIGTFSSIYLNEVYPERYNTNEYFFVYVYLKDSEQEFSIKLNSQDDVKIKELNYSNRFSHLVNEENKWSKYYLVSFDKIGNSLSLELHINNEVIASTQYRKDIE